ncbi:MAG: inositol-3-phosphate synthase [Patescibacteria group bacterium]|nr:inositol-3-phosphate synthase [Patescibacteria group bacterium]
MSKIKIAIIGVGNCASSLVQGIEYYTQNPDADGLMYRDIGPYKVSDIEIVLAIDVDYRKIGRDISEAIFAEPNCTKKFSEVPNKKVIVKMGNVLDGVANHMRDFFQVDSKMISVDIVSELKRSSADICICYLPVGSAEAARFYAQACLDAGVAFVNAIPEFICSDTQWVEKFIEKGIPCAGDDIKSQVGATIVHRMVTRLIEDRGHKIDNTYQLNIGGNTDFLNMKDENRIVSKRISKTNAVTSILDNKKIGVRIGPSDYIPHLKDNKVCYINVKGTQFGGVPFELDLKLSVEDSPNSAGVMTEIIRSLKIAKDRGMSGNINEISSYTCKSPAKQIRDSEAKKIFENFVNEQYGKL